MEERYETVGINPGDAVCYMSKTDVPSTAFQTAVALAEYEARTSEPPKEHVMVKTSHIEQVVEMSAAFKTYMENFKRNGAKRAYLEGARMDEQSREDGRLRKKELDTVRKPRDEK